MTSASAGDGAGRDVDAEDRAADDEARRPRRTTPFAITGSERPRKSGSRLARA